MVYIYIYKSRKKYTVITQFDYGFKKQYKKSQKSNGMDGWLVVKVVLKIVYSNQPNKNKVTLATQNNDAKCCELRGNNSL
jgi:hypothetical protein